jgi:fatty-acyl-CoA synthase
MHSTSTLGVLIDGAPAQRPALAIGERTLGYAALAAEARRLAHGLSALGIGRGDRVALWLPNIPEWLALYVALTRLGAVAVALNTRFRSAEVGDIVGRAGCRALALAPGFRGIDFPSILAAVDAAALDRVETLILCGEEAVMGSALPQKRRVRYRDLASAPEFAEDRGAPELGSVIFTTSGTTRAPKLVLHAQRSVVVHGRDVARGFALAGGAVLQSLPFCGVFGFSQAIAGLAAGATLVLQPAWDAEEAARLLERWQVTAFNGTDAMVQGLLDCASEAALLRIPFAGYAAFDPALGDIGERAERAGLKLVGLYGMSEVQALFARRRQEEPLERRCLPGGVPISPAAAVRVRDPDTGRLLAVGESGELEMRGPSLLREYFGDERATRAALTDDGFVRTGDLGRLLEDGSFLFEARMGDVLRLSGFLVAPAEIEAYLQRHPSIDGAQVVGVSTAAGLKPVAFVTLREGALFDEARLAAHCAAGLARYKVPARILAIEAFPTTMSPNGRKIRKAELRERANALLAAGA